MPCCFGLPCPLALISQSHFFIGATPFRWHPFGRTMASSNYLIHTFGCGVVLENIGQKGSTVLYRLIGALPHLGVAAHLVLLSSPFRSVIFYILPDKMNHLFFCIALIHTSEERSPPINLALLFLLSHYIRQDCFEILRMFLRKFT